MASNLTPRQQRFVEAYSGNATEAARMAGYTGSDNVLGKTGYDLLRNPKVASAIKARQDRETQSLIATRQKRQEFWTSVMHDAAEDMRNRLKASELLGRSEADFVEKHHVEGSLSIRVVDPYAEPKGG